MKTTGWGIPTFGAVRAFFQRPYPKRAAAAVAGALGGFAYYHYVGCASGTCPITGNPYISTLYGGAVGYLLLPSRKAKARSKPADPDNKE